jgi:hypothetical protein
VVIAQFILVSSHFQVIPDIPNYNIIHPIIYRLRDASFYNMNCGPRAATIYDNNSSPNYSWQRQFSEQVCYIIAIQYYCWGTGLPYVLHIRRMDHNLPRRPRAGWWVLTTANAAETNGLTCFPKHGGAPGIKFLVTHPMTDQRCLTSAIARRSALTAGPSSSSY